MYICSKKTPGPAIKHQVFYIHKSMESMALHLELPSKHASPTVFPKYDVMEEIPNPKQPPGMQKKTCKQWDFNYQPQLVFSPDFWSINRSGTQAVGLLDATHELIFYEGTHLDEMICCLFVHLCERKIRIKNHHLYQKITNHNSKYTW